MNQWIKIRQRVLKEGVSKRQIMRETGMHWETLKKVLEHSIPPAYERSKPPKKPKIGPYLNRIRQILEQDKFIHKKQRHTAKRIWQVLKEEGFTGGYTIVKDAVRQLKLTMKEVYMPLIHHPGEAQVDFGHALVKALVTWLMEMAEHRQLDRTLKQLERQDILILDELGYVPFSRTAAELLFEVVSRAYERLSLIVTTNLPFESWVEIFGCERLTGALLDRLTHRVHIIEANGPSYRLRQSRKRLQKPDPDGEENDPPGQEESGPGDVQKM